MSEEKSNKSCFHIFFFFWHQLCIVSSTTMTSVRFHLLFLLLQVFLLQSHPVKSDDEHDKLLLCINEYRASLNLSALSKNNSAECFAEEIANQLEDQPCTGVIRPTTIPGNETRISNYPKAMVHCHLNQNNTRDGVVLPACIPDKSPDLVASNFTRSQYSRYLNDTKFTKVGIGSEGNWVVVVLATNTPAGSLDSTSLASKLGLTYLLFSCFLVSFLLC